MRVFNDLTRYNQYLHLPPPLHPLMDSRICKEAIPQFPLSSDEIQVNFFKIALKKNFPGEIRYGKNKYKTENGIMLFSEPGQVVSWDALTFWDGYAFVFHPAVFKAHPVASKISQYKYFSYDVADALFMTQEEAETITWLFTKIHQELQKSRGKAGVEIILTLLHVVLTYAEGYYQRQFGANSNLESSITAKVKVLLQNHYSDLSKPVLELPSASNIAQALNLSTNYLSDLVRKETGKSTIDLIQEFITDQAEILLLQTGLNVSDVANQLGFANLSYFSRLYKKIKGISPGMVRNQGKG